MYWRNKKNCRVHQNPDRRRHPSLALHRCRQRANQAARDVGAPVVELHTGAYADAHSHAEQLKQFERLQNGAHFAGDLGLVVNAGHGLTIHNVTPVAQILAIRELNIGHSLISQALFLGLPEAVRQMKEAMFRARLLP